MSPKAFFRERQVLDALVAEAVKTVFDEYVDQHGLEEIAHIFSRGVKIEVGDLAVRASCVEFVLAGLYATDRISRHQQHGRIVPEAFTSKALS